MRSLVEPDVELDVDLKVEPEAENARFAAATRSMHPRFLQSKTLPRGGGMCGSVIMPSFRRALF